MMRYLLLPLTRLLAVFLTLNLLAPPVAALPGPQRRVHDSGVRYFNITSTPLGCGNSSLVGSDNAEQIWNYLVGKLSQDPNPEVAKFAKQQAAGVMGNMQAESGFEPQRLQGTAPGVKTPADAVGSRNIGWGIVQWTPASKMIDPTKAAGKDPNDLGVQLEFLWNQLVESTGPAAEKAAGDDLKRQTTVRGAALSFLYKYERPGIPTPEKRVQFAENIFVQYGSGTNIVTAGGGNECGGASLDGCPTGPVGRDQTTSVQGIQVHGCIAQEVDRILTLAKSQGLNMSGGGWRDNQQQIALRQAHGCGGSRIYDSGCIGSPPTAVPGKSNHESGTAVDYTCGGGIIPSRSHPCFTFLANNTSLKNLPSEPWHWSNDGK